MTRLAAVDDAATDFHDDEEADATVDDGDEPYGDIRIIMINGNIINIFISSNSSIIIHININRWLHACVFYMNTISGIRRVTTPSFFWRFMTWYVPTPRREWARADVGACADYRYVH